MSQETITTFNIVGDIVTDFGNELAPISPILSDEEYVSPILDRSDSGQLNAPIKKKRPYRIIKNELNPVKKNLGHVFNFILENLERDQLNDDRDRDSDSDSDSNNDNDSISSYNESEFSFDPLLNNFDSDGEPDESNDYYDYGMTYRPKSP